ncbi:hypothetical protein CEK26_003727 [Fusarium fujikuroi]|nr:hypothetical protein CEK26_003727 [Fusarium fujikuroi]
MADTMGRINVCTSELSHERDYILGRVLSLVLYVPFASGLRSMREDSDGEARPIDLLTRTGSPEFPQVLGDTTVLSVSVYGGAGNSRADPAMLTSVDGELSISAPLQVALSYSLSA